MNCLITKTIYYSLVYKLTYVQFKELDEIQDFFYFFSFF